MKTKTKRFTSLFPFVVNKFRFNNSSQHSPFLSSSSGFYYFDGNRTVTHISWRKIKNLPQKLVNHASALLGRTLYVFVPPARKVFSQSRIYKLDVDSYAWEETPIKGKIAGRLFAHTVDNSQIIIYGKAGFLLKRGDKCFMFNQLKGTCVKHSRFPLINYGLPTVLNNQLWVAGESYDLPSHCTLVHNPVTVGPVSSVGKGSFQRYRPPYSTPGTYTGRLAGASENSRDVNLAAVGNWLYAIGSSGDSTHLEVRRLDPQIGKWEEIKTVQLPEPRYGFTLNMVEKKIIVYGGYAKLAGVKSHPGFGVLSFDTEKLQWEDVKEEGEIPKPASLHSATNVENNKILVLGGKNEMRSFATLYMMTVN